MKTTMILIALLITGPAWGQKVYKCPQPDGSLKYQSTRCPDGTRGRIQIKDNGVVTGPANAVVSSPTVPTTQPTPVAAPFRPAPAPRSRSVTDSQAWKGLDKIQAESTSTINALQRLQR